MKKVTIMIPTYNQSKYIEQCLNSALAQDYSYLEVVISDDSTDNETEKIIKEKYLCDSRVKYFHNIPALGRVGNYHKTLYERATGDYVLNLDGDDWLIDNLYLSKAVSILAQHKTVVCVTANVIIYNATQSSYLYKKGVNATLRPIMKGGDYLYKYVMESVSFNHMTSLYKRKEAIKIGFYDKDITFSDGESFFRLFSKHDIAFISQNIGIWRKHNNNASYNNYFTIDLKSIFALEESVEQACKGENFGSLSVEAWCKKLKLKNFYAIISLNIKQLNFHHVLNLLRTIYKYDKQLFLQFLSYGSFTSASSIIRKLKV